MIHPREVIRQLVSQAGTDSSGKWMSVENAEKFAELVIEAYNKQHIQSTQLGQEQT